MADTHDTTSVAPGTGTDEDEGGGPARGTSTLRRLSGAAWPLWRPALLFVASRCMVWLVWVAAAAAKPDLSFRIATFRWDSSWYASIVEPGYRDAAEGPSNLAFFPGFPMVGRALTAVGLTPYRSLMLVVFVSGLVATCLVWLLARDLSDDERFADRAAALFAFAPGAFVLSLGYSEALYLVLAVGACWALVRHQWLLAGVLCAFATSTRPNGVELVVTAAVCSGVAIWRHREWRSLVAPALAPLGFVLYLAYVWHVTGEPLGWFRVQDQGWKQGIDLIGARLENIGSIFSSIEDGTRPDWNKLIPTVGIVVAGLAFWQMRRWRPPLALVVFSITSIFLAFTSVAVGLRPRMLLAAFPLGMALAWAARRDAVWSTLLAVSACLMCVLAFVVVTTLYITP